MHLSLKQMQEFLHMKFTIGYQQLKKKRKKLSFTFVLKDIKFPVVIYLKKISGILFNTCQNYTTPKSKTFFKCL